jgi:two-component system sensor histidine kinase UhpB
VENGRQLRLIIVEDNLSDVALLLRELRRGGFEPSWERVETERAFLGALRTRPDLLIADCSDRELTVRRLLELLHQRGDPLPVIAVAGSPYEETAVEAMRHGAADYVLKDRLARLVPSVRRVLDCRRASEEHGRTQRELRAAEARYRRLVEQIPAIVYAWGATDKLDTFAELYVSPQIEQILGFAPEEWLANPHLWIDRLHPEDRDTALAATARSVENGSPFQLEYRMIAKDGRTVWLRDEAAVLTRDEEGRAIFLGVQIDITAGKEADDERKRAREQIRKLDLQRRDLLGRLVGAQEEERRRIAEDIHDDTIQGLAALAIRIDSLGHVRPDLEEDEQFVAVRDGVHDTMSRLRHLMFELHPRDLDTAGLASTVRGHLHELGRIANAPTYELRASLSHEPSLNTRMVLYRIVQEAIVNARKHSSATHVLVLLEEDKGGFLARIEDDGVGFDVDAPTSTLPHHVGLTSMRERAELAGGWLQIDSTPRRGTTVETWIPDAAEPSDSPTDTA